MKRRVGVLLLLAALEWQQAVADETATHAANTGQPTESKSAENGPDEQISGAILDELYEDAIDYASQDLASTERASGPDHPNTALSLHNLASLYAANKRFDDAIPLFRRSLAIRDKLLRPEHPDTAIALASLAGLYWSTGKHADALPLFRRSLTIFAKQPGSKGSATAGLEELGDLVQSGVSSAETQILLQQALTIFSHQLANEQFDTVHSLHLLALLFQLMGNEKSSLAFFLRALAIPLQQPGIDELDIAGKLDGQASVQGIVGNYTGALLLYHLVLAIDEKQLGKEDSDVAVDLSHLADLYQTVALPGLALPLYQQMHDIREKELGAEHPDMAESLNNLAYLYQASGDYVSALPLYQRALAIWEKQLGPEHRNTAIVLYNLETLYQAMGNYVAALPLCQRALDIREKQLGPDHRDTALSLQSLGHLYFIMGNNTAAHPLYQRSLAIIEKLSGPEHPDTAISLATLAGLYQMMDNPKAALPLQQRALGIWEKQLDSGSQDTANVRLQMADLHLKMGNYPASLPLYQQSLAVQEKQLGPEHPDIAVTLNDLASLQLRLGNDAEELALLQRALAIREKRTGATHLATAQSLNRLAHVHREMGDYDAALAHHQRALAITEQQLGPEHTETAICLKFIADLYHESGDYAAALPLLQRSLAIQEKQVGLDHRHTAYSLNSLGMLYRSMGDYESALSFYQRALSILEKQLGPDHTETASALLNLAALHKSMGHYAIALPLYQRALAIAEKQLGPEHVDTASSLSHLGHLYDRMGDYQAALPPTRRALAIFEKELEPDNQRTAQSLATLAHIHQSLGDTTTALPLLQRSLSIHETLFSAGHPSITDSTFRLADYFATIDERATAIVLGKKAVNNTQITRTNLSTLDQVLQADFLQANQHIYRQTADWLIEAGRLPEAQQVLAMLKEEEYFEFVRRDTQSASTLSTRAAYNEREADWTTQYDTISHQLVSISREMDKLKQKARAGQLSAQEQAEQTRYRDELKVARLAFQATLDDLAERFKTVEAGRAIEFGEKNLASLRALQGTLQQLGEGVVLVHYLITEDTLHILLTTPTIQVARRTEITTSELNPLVNDYREVLQDPAKADKPLGERLHTILIAPIADDLQQAGAQTLMLSLDGTLRYIPAGSLYDGVHYLAERYRLVMYTEASKDKLKDIPRVDWTLSALGLSMAHPGFSALPGVPLELDGIVKESATDDTGVLDGRVLMDQAFNHDSLMAILDDARPVLHIASHFAFQPGTEADSFLLLGDGSHLSLKTIKEDDFSFNDVDLLTLSACNTAVGGHDAAGKEIEGFGALAQRQGAKGVLATLWQVADGSTAYFMQNVYRLRQQQPGMSKAEAIRQVQQSFISGHATPGIASVNRGMTYAQTSAEGSTAGYRHPYYWAPFVLMGNWL